MCADNSTNTKTDRNGQKGKKKKKLHVSRFRCHLSLVMSHVSCVTCCVSPVTCHLSLTPTATATEARRILATQQPVYLFNKLTAALRERQHGYGTRHGTGRRARASPPLTRPSSIQSTTTISSEPGRPVRAAKRAGALFQ